MLPTRLGGVLTTRELAERDQIRLQPCCRDGTQGQRQPGRGLPTG